MDIHRPERTERGRERTRKQRKKKGSSGGRGGRGLSGARDLVAQPHVTAVGPWVGCLNSLWLHFLFCTSTSLRRAVG